MKNIKITAIALGIGTLFLTGCAVTPEPLGPRDILKRVENDQFKIYAAQDPVFAPISFNEALARSLKYNLDLRLKLMETAQRRGLADLGKYDMLPNLLASAGYSNRSNYSASNSYTIDPLASDPTQRFVDAQAGTPYSGSQERTRHLSNVELSWNLLDFGVGYYAAKQAANEVLIAEERKRRVVQNILSDVRSAYWRALGAQRLIDQANALDAEVQKALARSRQAEAQGLVSPKDSLQYQRLLLDAVDLLASRRAELNLAKRELAALMNITPGTPFTVAEIAEPELRPAPLNVAELENLALTYRPELRQEDYKVRVTASEARKQMLGLLPNVNVSANWQHDSNKYLYENNWLDTALNVNFNLFKLFKVGATKQAAQNAEAVDDTRRMALSIAVLTQVRVAIERYKLNLEELKVANESSLVDQRMLAFAQAAVGSQANAELEAIRAKTRALNSEFKRYGAYAAAQAAFGRIYNSVGLEVMPPKLDESKSLEEVGKQIMSHVSMIENNQFAHASVIADTLPHFDVQVSGMPQDVGSRIEAGVSQVFSSNRMPTKNGADHHVKMSLVLKPVTRGVRPASWLISAYEGERELGQSTYSSTLTASPSNRALQVFAESAVMANLGTVRAWLMDASPKEAAK